MRFLMMLLVLVIVGCSKEPEKTTNTKNEPVMVQPPPQEPEQPKLDFITLDAAIEAIKPTMTDTVNDVSVGASNLAMWSVNNLKWSELNLLARSKHSLIMKDPDTERGKLLCVIGRIIEIHAQKSDGHKFYTGGLIDKGRIYRFIAVHSTGDIVERSEAHFCGVVIGKQSYANSAGGMTHAAFLVGMFALPENKKDTRPIGNSI